MKKSLKSLPVVKLHDSVRYFKIQYWTENDSSGSFSFLQPLPDSVLILEHSLVLRNVKFVSRWLGTIFYPTFTLFPNTRLPLWLKERPNVRLRKFILRRQWQGRVGRRPGEHWGVKGVHTIGS